LEENSVNYKLISEKENGTLTKELAVSSLSYDGVPGELPGYWMHALAYLFAFTFSRRKSLTTAHPKYHHKAAPCLNLKILSTQMWQIKEKNTAKFKPFVQKTKSIY
jgi:hypothetical protein